MDVYKDRCAHLIKTINALINEVQNDYFIPQMLVHKKSAEFIPERIQELFQALLDDEYQDFSIYTTKSIEELYNEIRSSRMIFDQDKFSNERAINRVKLYNKNIKMEYDSNSQRLSKLKQIGKASLDEYEGRISKIEQSISDITKMSSKIRNRIQRLQSFCLSERNLYDEMYNSQIFQLRQTFRKAISQIKAYANDYQIVRTVSKSKLKRLIQQYEVQNSSLSNSINQILQIFGSDMLESECEIQSQLSQFIQNIHQPLSINEKRIRNDNIDKSIEKYIKRMDDEIQNARIKINEKEIKLNQKIGSLHVKSTVAPRNLRAIYASRQKITYTIPNENEVNYRYD